MRCGVTKRCYVFWEGLGQPALHSTWDIAFKSEAGRLRLVWPVARMLATVWGCFEATAPTSLAAYEGPTPNRQCFEDSWVPQSSEIPSIHLGTLRLGHISTVRLKGVLLSNRRGTGTSTGELGPDFEGLGAEEAPSSPESNIRSLDTGEFRPALPELTGIRTSEVGYR